MRSIRATCQSCPNALSLCPCHLLNLQETTSSLCIHACTEYNRLARALSRHCFTQLLGFPLQLVGVLSLPWAYLKYVDEGDSIVDDLGSAAVSCLSSCTRGNAFFACVGSVQLLVQSGC